MRLIVRFLLLCALLALAPSAHSQRPSPRAEFMPDTNSRHRKGEYTFARLMYDSYGYRNRMWMTDYPKADYQLIMGLRNWCRSGLVISDDPAQVPIKDKDLSKYPFIYAVEPGFMQLSTEDAAALREYLLRGGFWMLDDFWGEYEWQNVQEQLRKVFPEYTIQELPLNHSIFHCYFDIEEIAQVPNGPLYISYGTTAEKGGTVPHYEGIVNEDGRVMVFIARNMDNGDAWEWIDDPQYPLKYGLAAYRLGMNVIVYAMTH